MTTLDKYELDSIKDAAECIREFQRGEGSRRMANAACQEMQDLAFHEKFSNGDRKAFDGIAQALEDLGAGDNPSETDISAALVNLEKIIAWGVH